VLAGAVAAADDEVLLLELPHAPIASDATTASPPQRIPEAQCLRYSLITILATPPWANARTFMLM
jgi:hypothetical protein